MHKLILHKPAPHIAAEIMAAVHEDLKPGALQMEVGTGHLYANGTRKEMYQLHMDIEKSLESRGVSEYIVEHVNLKNKDMEKSAAIAEAMREVGIATNQEALEFMIREHPTATVHDLGQVLQFLKGMEA